jgi:hypothetical protein
MEVLSVVELEDLETVRRHEEGLGPSNVLDGTMKEDGGSDIDSGVDVSVAGLIS